jgi:hypothetical protein
MENILDIINSGQTTTPKALEIYDAAEAVDFNFMWGRWKGSSLKTQATLDGLLEETGWFGKEFIDAETVHPLLYYLPDGQHLFALNPVYAYFGSKPLLIWAKKNVNIIRKVILFFRFLLQTQEAKARLRMVEHRGKTSAAMVYDQKSIIDSFRKVDENTLLGYMDSKELPEPFFFILKRDKKR